MNSHGPKLCLVGSEEISNALETSSEDSEDVSISEMEGGADVPELERHNDEAVNDITDGWGSQDMFIEYEVVEGLQNNQSTSLPHFPDSAPQSHSSTDNEVEEIDPTDIPSTSNSMEVIVTSCSRNPSGRKSSVIWESFKTTKINNKITSNTCKHCRAEVSPQALRMTRHLEKCTKKGSAHAGKKLVNTVQKTVSSSTKRPSLQPFLEHTADERLTAREPDCKLIVPVKKQANIGQYTTAISSKRSEILDVKLGRLIFANNLSFNLLENTQFKDFVTSLNPAYKVPSHKVVGTTILDKVYREVTTEMEKQLKNSKGVLLQDGWSTNQNQQVISHCLSTGNKSYFLMSESPGISSADAECCYRMLQKAIKEAETKYHCQIVGVVTDNCSTMQALQTLVRRDKDIEAYGCNAHLFNLLGKKFTPADVQEKVTTVQTFMKARHSTSAALKLLKANRPVLAGSTRWNSQIDSFMNYVQNHSRYLELARQIKQAGSAIDKEKMTAVLSVLNDPTVYDAVKDCIVILRPICTALDTAQKEQSTLADTVGSWINLGEVLPEEIVTSTYFKKQLNLGMTAVAVACYLLHPKYKGNGLNKTSKDKGLVWLSKHSPFNVIIAAELHKPASDYFYSAFLNREVYEKMRPVDWWAAGVTELIPKSFRDLMSSIFIMPASTASIERGFSTLGNIITKQRNRLKLEKATQLCTINNHFRLQQQTTDRQELKNTRKGKKRDFDELEISE